jgi:hypothetical protein
VIGQGPARLKRWLRREAEVVAKARPERAKFVVASLPRSGSTAVYRVLKSDPSLSIAYEPPFFGCGPDPLQVGDVAARYLRSFDGIKHVWDPNGWPIANPEHVSSLEVLVRSGELIASNRAVLDCAGRIAILRRRNLFERTLSDLWGQQTNLWGHDHDRSYDRSEVPKYREALARHIPRPIDPEVFGWYMHNAEAWEEAILAGLQPGSTKIFFYEDLFPPGPRETGVPSKWQELAEWLEVGPDFEAPEVRQIMAPAAKLNSPDIYARIPNFDVLKERFGRGSEV